METKRSFRVEGMTCAHCQHRIEKALKNTTGVQYAAVNYHTGAAEVAYDAAETSFETISAVIENLGYHTLEGDSHNTVPRIIGTLVIILALFMLMRTFTTSKFAAAFPLAQEGMSYGMLLIIGVLTGVHCIAMCGGINLSQTLRKEKEEGSGTGAVLLPGILYNGGRLVSYTAAGVLVGALGSVITVSGYFQGVVQLAAGVFMVIMGINMLGLFPALRRFSPRALVRHIPKISAQKTDGQKTNRTLVRRGPLIVGFLNGFMPCGPLQAMQLYALSTGSPIRGGISMFLFCAGTIPLMFALGTASSALSGVKGGAFSRRVMQTGAILVAALGLVMFSNGWTMTGFPVTGFADKSASVPEKNASESRRQTQTAADSGPRVPVIENGVQIVNSVLQPNRYPAITVQQGIPVRWTINAPPGNINGCNNRMIIYDYDFEYVFKQGKNVIEFTPLQAGKFRYSCWMGMIRSTITVLADAGKEIK